MTLPGTYQGVRASNQTGPTKFAPFGPFTPQLLIHFYNTFDNMYQAFQNGEIDISDYQLQSTSQVNTFCGNTDFYCSSPQAELGIYQEEINSHTPFMGISLFQARTTSPASFSTTSTATACGVGFGSLSISLFNQENGTLVKDSLNTLTASNQPSGSPSATVSDSGATGTYVVPCILAGTYSLRTLTYGGTVTVSIASNTLTSGTFNVNWNSPSNVKPTQARALLGAAIAHLFDDPEFVTGFFGNVAQAPCGYAVTTQGSSCPTGVGLGYQGGSAPATGTTPTQIDNAECQFGNHPWLNIAGCTAGSSGHDIGPYNIADDNIGAGTLWWNTGGAALGVGSAGYSGTADLRAACDDFVSMGLTLSSSTATCLSVANAASGTTDPGTYDHINAAGTGHIIDYVRHTLDGRNQFGQIIADTLDFLFGTPMDRSGNVGFVGVVCYGACPQYTPKYWTYSQVTPIVFEDTPASGGSPDAWQLYTGGQGFDPTPDQLFIDRNSVNSGSICAGTPAVKPNNYDLWCDPESDTWSSAGESGATFAVGGAYFNKAVYKEIQYGVQAEGNAFVDTFVENNGFNYQQCTTACANTQASLVSTLGIGTLAGGALFTELNAKQVPGYDACAVTGHPTNCAAYQPGGGNPNLIRRGFSQDTVNISPFTFNSVWEADVLASVFDTMLNTAPSTGGANAQFIDWGTTSHSSSFNPNEVGCNSITGCVTGVTTQIWHLRNDLKFQDGNDVKATDVAYSIIAYRDVPSGSLQSFVINVVSATGLDCGTGQPCKTLQVKLQGAGALLEFNIGAAPFILEKSLWKPVCGDPPVAGGNCASATFDPMFPSTNSPGILVGTGLWSCIVPTATAQVVPAGHIGGPCSETSAGVLTGGGALGPDGRILLTENVNYQRCCPRDLPAGIDPNHPTGVSATLSSLYAISYADFSKHGVVNILDLAAVASAYHQADPYWCSAAIATNPNIGCQAQTGTPLPCATTSTYIINGVSTAVCTGATNLATVAIYFGHGITAPFTPQNLAQVDPQIDPFFCTPSGAPVAPNTIPCV